ncbi:hypothetical protein F2Q68_00038321, partial [Brassica cretica]
MNHDISCRGNKCCQADPPSGIGQIVGISMEEFSSNKTRERGCRVAFLTVENRDRPAYPVAKFTDPQWFYNRQYVILQLRWAIPMTNLSFVNSLRCAHYEMLQYIDGINPCGCSNTDDGRAMRQGGTCVNTPGDFQCVVKKNKTVPITIGLCVGFGVLMFSGVTLWLYKFIKKQRKINRKKKLFKRNGGLLLKQQLTATEGNIEKTKVFTSKELEKATENFVQLECFNKVSKINHRNIVKLIGCCLETEVPLLVYEFISNGNLFEHLHCEIDESTMTTWEMRLRIVIDIAGALSYLHSAAASPIFHSEVKSTNIMLDEKYRAKVADFGTSRLVTVDYTHLTTVVSGTAGYVDPEYFQSSQFTDKSDVYSFGVVLVELITREKPILLMRFQQSRTLATYFIFAMEENRVVDIIDPRIRDDCNQEQVMAASQLARRCLNLNGRSRPSMREVSMELERIRSPNGNSHSHVHVEGINAEEVAAEINIGVE